MPYEASTVLVTGGTGFLGHALVRELTRADAVLAPAEIRLFDRRAAPFADPRVRLLQGDVRDEEALRSACEGVDVVFHCAALVDWGQHPESEVEAINLGGTLRLLRAVTEASVPALVATSTMDVVYDGGPIVDGDERLPYPQVFHGAYPRTKAAAEQAVLQADGAQLDDGRALRACVLRPCGMYGEGDPYHVSSLLRLVQRRAFPFRIGDGRARFQHVYVGNVAHAHLLAARALLAGAPVAGQVYFVTDHPALNFFSFMEPIIEGLGYRLPPARRSLPASLMLGVASGVEALAWLVRPLFHVAPSVTRFSVRMVSQDYTFVGDKARRELGYQPRYDEQEAIARTVAHFAAHGPV